jgi:hypothetical protein
MKLLAVLLLFSAGLQAQTTVPPSQLWPGTIVGVMVCLPPGTTGAGCKVAVLDASIVLDTSVTPPVLRAVSIPAKIHTHSGLVKLVALNGLYSVPTAAVNVKLHRNGILQFLGEDYTLAGGTITPRFPDGWSVSLVIADYEIP